MEFLRSQRSLNVVAGMKKTNDHAEPTKNKYIYIAGHFNCV